MTHLGSTTSATPRTSSKRIVSNVISNGISQLWLLALLVISVPIVVHGIGEDAYGIFVLATSLLGYVALLDLGLTPAVVRAITMHHTTGDTVRLERVIGTALLLLIGLGVLGGCVLLLFTPILVGNLLHVPDSLQADARFVLRLTAVGFACNMSLVVFIAIPQGLQRIDLLATRNVMLSTATAIVQVAAVLLGGGLRWLAIGTLTISILSLLLFVGVAKRLLPDVRFVPRIDRTALRELTGFGLMKFLNQAAGILIFQADRLIVAAFLPIAAVTYYVVPVNVTQKFGVLQSSISTAFFPAATEMHTADQAERFQDLYLAAMKLVVTLLFPLSILTAGFAWPLLDAWLGREFADASAHILIVLAIAYGLATLSTIPSLAAEAMGYPHWTAANSLISAAINIGMTLLLVPKFGAVGAAYALLLNYGIQGFIFVFVVQRWLIGIPLLRVIYQVLLRPLAAASILTLYVLLLASHIHGLVEVLVVSATGGVLYILLTVLLGVWNQREMGLAHDMVESLVGKMRRGIA